MDAWLNDCMVNAPSPSPQHLVGGYAALRLDGCMRNGTKRLSISINTEALKFITCNHTDMHSCLATIKTGNINRWII